MSDLDNFTFEGESDSGSESHYVSQRKQRAEPPAKLQPPLTPMIDVTFQLLLYFLLTSTFREDEGLIPGSLPAEGSVAMKQVTPLKPIRIMLVPNSGDGGYNEKAMYDVDNLQPVDSPEALYKILLRRKKAVRSDEVPVVIHAPAEVRWKFVTEAFNAAVHAKFKNIGFAPTG